jgi:membrane-associated protein
MDLLAQFIDLFLHLDTHLAAVIAQYGTWTYSLLVLIVFSETGLVITPILPGDSLLFAAGSFAALGALNAHLLFVTLTIAAVAGDAVNYSIGKSLGPKILRSEKSRIFKKEYLERTRAFYEKHGAKTIVLARFVPIVRTFAPFVAGVGKMPYATFGMYNVLGGVLWVGLFVYGGYFFGSIPVVKENFEWVILTIIVVSILPGVVEYIRARKTSV